MSLSLITDRTSADVAHRATIREKIKARTATGAEWSEWLNGMKGAYNATDLNRVGHNVSYLAGLLNGYGYSVAVSPKVDWQIGDTPQPSDRAAYLADIEALKAAFYGSTPLPGSMKKLTVEDANNIERLLCEIEQNIHNMTEAWYYCGELYCGEV